MELHEQILGLILGIFFLAIASFGLRRFGSKREVSVWLPRTGSIGPYKWTEDRTGFLLALGMNSFFMIAGFISLARVLSSIL